MGQFFGPVYTLWGNITLVGEIIAACRCSPFINVSRGISAIRLWPYTFGENPEYPFCSCELRFWINSRLISHKEFSALTSQGVYSPPHRGWLICPGIVSHSLLCNRVSLAKPYIPQNQKFFFGGHPARSHPVRFRSFRSRSFTDALSSLITIQRYSRT